MLPTIRSLSPPSVSDVCTHIHIQSPATVNVMEVVEQLLAETDAASADAEGTNYSGSAIRDLLQRFEDEILGK